MPGFEKIDDLEKQAVIDVFDEGAVFFAHGFDKVRKKYHVREFEKSFAKDFKTKYALAVSSGTAAIKIALKSLGVSSGDEVITQSFNFVATIEAIVECGAKPIIANIDDSLNIDLNHMQTLITKKTKAVVPVHMLGFASDIFEMQKTLKSLNIPILEDNCEAIGATHLNKYLGTIGDAGALSFDHGKMITTGEGGMVLTSDEFIDKYAREYHDHGHENNPNLPRGKDTHSIHGFNYRMTELQGSIGKVQLKKLPTMIEDNKKRYLSLYDEIKNKFKTRPILSGSSPTYDTLIIIEEKKEIREKIIDILKLANIGTKNLPDAMEWHCASFWDHILSSNQINEISKSKEILDNCVAVPIWLRKAQSDYSKLGVKLKSI